MRVDLDEELRMPSLFFVGTQEKLHVFTQFITYHVQGAVTGSRCTTGASLGQVLLGASVNKTDEIPCCHGAYVLTAWRQTQITRQVGW